MSTWRDLSVVGFPILLAAAACSGKAAPPPGDVTTVTPPSSAMAAEPSPAPPETASAAPPATAEPAPAPSASAESPTAEPAPTRSLGDRLFARTVSYMLNYAVSPAKEKVTQACSAKSGSDPAAQAACVEKERGKLVSDVLVFEKSDKGMTWTVYKRSGSQLTETFSAQVDVASDSPEKIELKIKSEKGPRQLFAGKKQITVLSESDSSVALDEPQLGRLVYEARIGLMDSTGK